MQAAATLGVSVLGGGVRDGDGKDDAARVVVAERHGAIEDAAAVVARSTAREERCVPARV